MMCPMCAASVPTDELRCPRCATGLAEYASAWYLPDRLFNDGVTRLNRDDPVGAATCFARACGLRPDDVEARQAWAYACQRAGRLEEAAGLLLDAMELQPSPELDQHYAEVLAQLNRQEAGRAQATAQVTRVRVVRVKKSRAARRKKS